MTVSELDRKARSQIVSRRYKATVERRAKLADQFRAEILHEMGVESVTGSRSALLEAAVSSYVQVAEISTAFRDARASVRSVQQLGLARSELRRCLRGLGLVERDDSEGNGLDSPPPNASLAERRAWSTAYVERALAESRTEKP